MPSDTSEKICGTIVEDTLGNAFKMLSETLLETLDMKDGNVLETLAEMPKNVTKPTDHVQRHIHVHIHM